MNRLARVTLGAVLLMGLANPLPAQEGPPEMFWVYQEFVKPSMLQEYEAASKEMFELMGSATEAASSIQFVAIAGSEFGYAYVFPIEGFAGVDNAWQSWEAMVEEVGQERYAGVAAQAAKTIDHSASFVLLLREDLSPNLEMTALTAERPFRMYHYWYVTPGMESELEGVIKKFMDLYEAKGIEHGWRVYQAMMGMDLPMYLVVETAADEADYFATMKEVQAMVGADGQALSREALKYTRTVEIQHGTIRPDLSFPQTTAAGGS